ncbi:MAG: HAMP domain-containing sensor histidine kinase [Cyclobacteriaceae bacterium]
MKNTPIRLIILLGSLTLIGIISTQIFWVSKAIKNQEQQFSHNVQMALRNVVESLCEINGNDISNDPIEQVSSNYFIARTNYSINLSSLDYLIRAELEKRNLKEDFEFGVYDCQTESMVYGDFISFGDEKVEPHGKLPKLHNEEYYFGVYFPNKSGSLDLGFWKFTSAITVLITVFFGYALFVILRQKRLSEIQRDFVNNMTHEFKTPLSTLMLSAEVLENEIRSEKGKRYAQIIKDESLRLQQHVSRFLDTTSIEHGAKTKKMPVDVDAAIREVADRFSGFGRQVDHDLRCGKMVLGDPENFEKVMSNLVDNAIKYGESKVEIKSWSEGKKIKIVVLNDGKPITPEEQQKVFDKFYRTPSGDRHDVKGFGLGLYFVKRSVEVIKGKIHLESGSSGTAFTLTLPAHE